ncbi:hypothetical protein POTOM_014019 [Populus tomentosa]|uniref:Dirigent protein n=1 Tax=Populus tomentosa TaxID=118781 RepID=A0A8X8D828_POPTO|nr:hypothetical protein POTOM_014019 [Populus tomentosa]
MRGKYGGDASMHTPKTLPFRQLLYVLCSITGRAQGFYDKKEIFAARLGFTFVLNSTEHKGSIDFSGADPLMNKTKDISVIGGTGDFFMTRGIATLMADAFQGEFYFRLRV